MKRKLKILLISSLTLLLLAPLTAALINWHMLASTAPHISGDKAELEKAQAALVLGAAVYPNGRLSDVLRDRAIKAMELYWAGKVDKLLISGDHGQPEYNEVSAVRDFFLAHDVPAQDIFLDHAGFDTYDSIYRAQSIFEIESLIVVTQNFHLPRAVYIGNSLGMDTQGYIADRQIYRSIDYYKKREFIARAKSFTDLLIKASPKYLGETFSIKGDGRETWD